MRVCILLVVILFSFTAVASGNDFEIYVPENARLKLNPPLVVMLHGCTQNADEFLHLTRIKQEADRRGFIVLAPRKDRSYIPPNNPLECWAWYWPNANKRQPERGDLKKIMNLVRGVKEKYQVDEDEIYVAGFSAGAVMSSILASCHPEVFSGAMIHSGIPYKGLRYSLGRKIRIEEMKGRSDIKSVMSELPKFARKRILKLQREAEDCANSVSGEKHKLKNVIVFQGGKDIVAWDRHGPTIFFQFITREEGEFKFTRSEGIYRTEFSGPGRKVTLYEIQEMHHGWAGGEKGERFSYDEGPEATKIMLDQFGL